ncbi:hypothetical protein HOK51_05760 [Candidatus Woesearchaeota archaeon]|jgi:hypothetical protein|nr:hypothetical protein [Candidatus Woesearchaeota archaeon]MBT6519335.1 hypothetical protein [Candidatus Woesearchaeota archaeon]MBT7366795.1 hypothetical protein [Candidatus Woesearchaeota archaeon]
MGEVLDTIIGGCGKVKDKYVGLNPTGKDAVKGGIGATVFILSSGFFLPLAAGAATIYYGGKLAKKGYEKLNEDPNQK